MRYCCCACYEPGIVAAVAAVGAAIDDVGDFAIAVAMTVAALLAATAVGDCCCRDDAGLVRHYAVVISGTGWLVLFL